MKPGKFATAFTILTRPGPWITWYLPSLQFSNKQAKLVSTQILITCLFWIPWNPNFFVWDLSKPYVGGNFWHYLPSDLWTGPSQSFKINHVKEKDLEMIKTNWWHRKHLHILCIVGHFTVSREKETCCQEAKLIILTRLLFWENSQWYLS